MAGSSKRFSLSTIPQLYRNLARWREILSVLSRFGVSGWVQRLSPSLAKEMFPQAKKEDVEHLTYETRVRLALSELGTTAIKLGQILSTRPDLVGSAMAAELEQLQAHVPPSPAEEIRAAIEKEMGRPIDEAFLGFDDEPVASASIAQVHGARLPIGGKAQDDETDGERVVVKVRRPGVEKIVRVDLEILAGLAQLADRIPDFQNYRPSTFVAELNRSLVRELDFSSERRHLQEFRRLFEDDDNVYIPRPYPELSGKGVLVMERLDGVPLSDRERLEELDHDVERIARRGARVYMEMIFLHGVYHADPHPGNFVVMDGDVIGLLDFGMVGRLDEQLREDIEEILLAVSAGDASHLTSIIHRVGKVPHDLDIAALSLDVAEFVAHYSSQPIGDFDLAAALNDMVSMIRRYRITLPARLAMLIKMLIVLEGSARQLQPRFNLVEVIAPYQRKLLLRRLSPKRRALKLFRLYGELESLLEVLPRNLVDLMERLQSGRFDVHLDHRGLEPSVNRLVFGLVTSALFLGSSLLVAFETPPIFHGFSILGASGMVVSFTLGLRLLRAINKSGHLDRHREGRDGL